MFVWTGAVFFFTHYFLPPSLFYSYNHYYTVLYGKYYSYDLSLFQLELNLLNVTLCFFKVIFLRYLIYLNSVILLMPWLLIDQISWIWKGIPCNRIFLCLCSEVVIAVSLWTTSIRVLDHLMRLVHFLISFPCLKKSLWLLLSVPCILWYQEI